MILSCGESLIDFVPEKGEDGTMKYSPCPGGSPFNTAITASRLGVPTAFFSKISTDFFGDMLLQRLHSNNISDTYLLRGPEPTTLAFVQRDDAGNARYAFYSNGSADRSITESELPNRVPDEISCIQIGSVALILEPVASTTERLVEHESSRRLISFDPNVRPTVMENEAAYRARIERLMAHTGLLKISDEDLEWLYPDASPAESAERLQRNGIPLVVMTRGKAGSVAFGPGFQVEQKGLPVPGGVVDTVGAGDSFHGGLLAALYHEGCLTRDAVHALSQDTVERIMYYAARVAAITCSREGAEPPWATELENFA